MICTKCSNEGILNTANGKEFYYCRSCKEEITLQPPPIIDVFQGIPEEDRKEYEEWLSYLVTNQHAGDGTFLQELAEQVELEFNKHFIQET